MLQKCKELSLLYNMGCTYDLPVTDPLGSITANTSDTILWLVVGLHQPH